MAMVIIHSQKSQRLLLLMLLSPPPFAVVVMVVAEIKWNSLRLQGLLLRQQQLLLHPKLPRLDGPCLDHGLGSPHTFLLLRPQLLLPPFRSPLTLLLRLLKVR